MERVFPGEKMKLKYVSSEEAGKRAGKEEFLQNVKVAVIPRLIGAEVG